MRKLQDRTIENAKSESHKQLKLKSTACSNAYTFSRGQDTLGDLQEHYAGRLHVLALTCIASYSYIVHVCSYQTHIITDIKTCNIESYYIVVSMNIVYGEVIST